MSEKLSLSNLVVRRIVKTAYPGFTGRRVFGKATTTATYHGTMWDGGSHYCYCVVDASTGRVRERIRSEGYMELSEYHRKSHPIERGSFVVKLSEGGFKYVEIMGHPDDFQSVGVHVSRENFRELAVTE